MAYPCFGCGDEVGSECLCKLCEDMIKKEIVNGQWCSKHQIIHWRGEECPLCKIEKQNGGMD